MTNVDCTFIPTGKLSIVCIVQVCASERERPGLGVGLGMCSEISR